MNHSPGPWTVVSALPTGRKSMAYVVNQRTPVDGSEYQHNARLIESAIDLLEDLQMAVWYWEQNLPKSAGQTELDDLKSARALIARLTNNPRALAPDLATEQALPPA